MTPAKIFRITHPNGTPAEVRAPKERVARDLLIYMSQDLDWEFGQATVQREEGGTAPPGDPEILWIGQPLIPTTPLRPAA
jgi:hypothetical protein